ncbi:c-type cytochrome [Pseudooceanicola sp. CBS1P-1]|uniref:C-type cytochrome n=1 Tax=Pseudooceanicola albus TaxID=2692189 RepID=A0A6L7G6W9_9RHOB|nr:MULTISPECIES: c-type cytochrome [Pseudooceanicola]MBT9385548.1 c-type cytochrome [Pseudooceanicola endophyticus]MXN19040.1 c-type cytochrome [Pseudooceanicola albus]
MYRSLYAAALLSLLAGHALAQPAGDPEAGKRLFNRCKACHSIVSPTKTYVLGGRTGPDLYGVIGHQAGARDDFRYGDDLKEAGEKGLVWNTENIQDYLKDPRGFISDQLGRKARVKMTFKLAKDQADVAAYLAQFSDADGAAKTGN